VSEFFFISHQKMSEEGDHDFVEPRWTLAIQHKNMKMFIEELDKMENINARLLDIGGFFGFSPLGFALLGCRGIRAGGACAKRLE
jgi:hypothetical protein